MRAWIAIVAATTLISCTPQTWTAVPGRGSPGGADLALMRTQYVCERDMRMAYDAPYIGSSLYDVVADVAIGLGRQGFMERCMRAHGYMPGPSPAPAVAGPDATAQAP